MKIRQFDNIRVLQRCPNCRKELRRNYNYKDKLVMVCPIIHGGCGYINIPKQKIISDF